jgi:hypothetical protein
MLYALTVSEGFVHWALDHGADGEATASALALIRDTIAQATAEGITPEPAAPSLLASLEAVLPYAEGEAESLYERWKSDGDFHIKETSDRCHRAIKNANAAIARARATGISPVPAAGGGAPTTPQKAARFEIEHNEEENPDRVYVLVDGLFDVRVIRTSEGVVVDVYPKDGFETIATTYAFDTDARQPGEDDEEPGSTSGDGHE